MVQNITQQVYTNNIPPPITPFIENWAKRPRDEKMNTPYQTFRKIIAWPEFHGNIALNFYSIKSSTKSGGFEWSGAWVKKIKAQGFGA